MRLVVAETDELEAKAALEMVHLPGASVQLNPAYMAPSDERLFIACGAPAVKLFQAMGWLPKKGGVEANRGKLFHAEPDGWPNPVEVGVTYAPTVAHIEPANFVDLQTDLAIYRRFETTGSMKATLGKYGYADDLSGVIDYVKAKHASTGEPVEVALDLETQGLYPWYPDKKIVTIQASAEIGMSDVVYCKNYWGSKLQDLINQVHWLATCPYVKIVGANFKFDILWMRVKWGIKFKNFIFDTCNAGSLVDENRANTLNLHTKVYAPDLGGYDDEFGRKYDKGKMEQVPLPDLLPYAGGDTDACLRVYRKVRDELMKDNLNPSGKPAKNSLASLYINIVHPTLKAVHKMEWNGAYVDVEKFHAFGEELDGRMHETMKKAAYFLPGPILDKHGGVNENGEAPLSKPNMIADFLFSPMGLNLEPEVTTEKSGKPSTAESHLSRYADHPDAKAVLELYLDYKQVSKMHGTYYKGFLNHLRPDGRWHSSYVIHKAGSGKNNESGAAGTVTGRGSATSPAFQCVGGESLIRTPTGMVMAKDLIDPLFPNGATGLVSFQTHVWTRRGVKATTCAFRSWRSDRLRIVMQSGIALECTPEHPILTAKFRTGGVWVKAKDLQAGQTVMHDRAFTEAPPPRWCTPQMAEAAGMILAVGELGGTSQGPLFIRMPMDHVKAFDALLDGFDVPLTRKEGMGVYVLPNEDDWTRNFARWVEDLSSGPNEPALIGLTGTARCWDALRGMYRCVGRYSGLRHGTVHFPLKSKPAAEFVVYQLAFRGQGGKFWHKNGRWQAEVSGAGSWYLADRIGITDGYPPKWRKNYEGKIGSHQAYGVAATTISHIEPADPGYVYDFTVPDLHEFQANGLVVHNTVPKHSYWGKRLRECIVAPDGRVIVACDYSQGELKVAACWAGEPNMIKAYRDGIDLHTLTAATVNGMTYEEAVYLKKHNPPAYDMLRQKGKAGNFGLLYGMGAYGFMEYAKTVYGVSMSLEEAEAMRDAFFDLYPGLVVWHNRQIMEARNYGYVRSPLGRVRHLPTIHSPLKKIRSGTERQAINSPIQGTLVDMLWWSMAIIERERPDQLWPFAQIHDQGLWYAPEDTYEADIKYAKDVMEHLPFEQKFGWKPDLDFTSDAEVGLNLAGLEKIKV